VKEDYRKSKVPEYEKPLEKSDAKVKEYEWMPLTKYLNTTQGSFKTTYDSPIRIEVNNDKRIDQLERDKDYLKEDCNKLRNKISTLESNSYLKRIEKLEHNVSSLANALDEWSGQTSKISSH
jgi:chromosome segregation ATPase